MQFGVDVMENSRKGKGRGFLTEIKSHFVKGRVILKRVYVMHLLSL